MTERERTTEQETVTETTVETEKVEEPTAPAAEPQVTTVAITPPARNA